MALDIDTTHVAEWTIRRLGLRMSPHEVLNNLTAQQDKGTPFVVLRYTDTDPARAQQVVNAIGRVESQKRYEPGLGKSRVTAALWAPATLPTTPVSPNPLRNGLIALVVGLALCAGFALVLPGSSAVSVAGGVSDSGGARGQKDGPSFDSEAGVRLAYDHFGGELYRMSFRTLNDDGLAEEAVQQTFLRAWRAADRFDPNSGSLRTWMFAIARNVTIDLARARAARPRRAGAEVEHHGQGAQEAAEESLRAWEIEEALRQIGPHHRHAIVQTYLLNRPCAEVAAEAGVPVGTMRSRLYYGLSASSI